MSTWLRDYLYVPLGGNRKGTRRTYVNLVLTMVLGGLWHGANWTFVLWGAWHGGLMALERALGAKNREVWPRLIALPLTFCLVIIGWVMFRAPDVATALNIYGGMIGINGLAVRPEVSWAIAPSELIMLAVGLTLCFLPLAPRLMDWRPAQGVNAAAMSVLAVLALTRMVAQTDSPFLYFQF